MAAIPIWFLPPLASPQTMMKLLQLPIYASGAEVSTQFYELESVQEYLHRYKHLVDFSEAPNVVSTPNTKKKKKKKKKQQKKKNNMETTALEMNANAPEGVAAVKAIRTLWDYGIQIQSIAAMSAILDSYVRGLPILPYVVAVKGVFAVESFVSPLSIEEDYLKQAEIQFSPRNYGERACQHSKDCYLLFQTTAMDKICKLFSHMVQRSKVSSCLKRIGDDAVLWLYTEEVIRNSLLLFAHLAEYEILQSRLLLLMPNFLEDCAGLRRHGVYAHASFAVLRRYACNATYYTALRAVGVFADFAEFLSTQTLYTNPSTYITLLRLVKSIPEEGKEKTALLVSPLEAPLHCGLHQRTDFDIELLYIYNAACLTSKENFWNKYVFRWCSFLFQTATTPCYHVLAPSNVMTAATECSGLFCIKPSDEKRLLIREIVSFRQQKRLLVAVINVLLHSFFNCPGALVTWREEANAKNMRHYHYLCALTDSKTDKKPQLVLFSENIRVAIQDVMHCVERLKAALNQGSFSYFYLPRYSLIMNLLSSASSGHNNSYHSKQVSHEITICSYAPCMRLVRPCFISVDKLNTWNKTGCLLRNARRYVQAGDSRIRLTFNQEFQSVLQDPFPKDFTKEELAVLARMNHQTAIWHYCSCRCYITASNSGTTTFS